MLAMAFIGLAFVSTHFFLSLSEVRSPLVQRIGEGGFLGLYSAVAGVLLVLLVMTYNEANRSAYWWYPDPLHYQIAMVVMWFAVVFVTASFMAPNPSSVGMGSKAKQGPQGILRVTRHPLLWGVGLWALSHLLANGDIVSVLFFLSFAILSFVGIWVLDRKKLQQLGDDWASYTQQTSVLPFAAIFAGRTAFAPKELLLPLAVGTGVYIALFWVHEYISGVEILVP